jgi:hypothetical protein
VQKALIVVALFACAILSARWIERGDYYDPVRGRRHCGAPPPAIQAWSSTNGTRRPADPEELDRWVRANPGRLNQLFGPSCRSALHSAARFGREDLAALLIDRGADVVARDDPRGHTPLHLAAQYGHANVAALLLQRGAEVDARTSMWRTPLHDAVSGLGGTSDLVGRVAVVGLLLASGADVNARERGSGRTPLDYAEADSFNPSNRERMLEALGAAANPSGAGAEELPAVERPFPGAGRR